LYSKLLAPLQAAVSELFVAQSATAIAEMIAIQIANARSVSARLAAIS
jgi:hypothetical protein